MGDLDLVIAARKYLGVPWKHQGRSRTGLDCIGLVVLSVRDCGLDAPLKAVYGRTQNYFQMKPVLMEFCQRIGAPRPGALLLYMTGSALHMGISSEDGMAIHSFNSGRGVIESTINFPISQSWAIKWPS